MSVTGSLFGLAYGDALAGPVEFLSVARIVARYGPGGPSDLDGSPALVTDDTQMTLAVGRALLATRTYDAAHLEPLLRREFVAWNESPENTRAPGITCMDACRSLATGRVWQAASRVGSKGCGANMRVAPVAFLAVPVDVRAGLAQFQAALTHGHPTALAATDLTGYAIRYLLDDRPLDELVAALRDRCAAERLRYHAEWLGDLWTYAGAGSPAAYAAAGWDECAAALAGLAGVAAGPDDGGDVCLATGDGWIAEEALASALLCVLRHPADPVAALRRAAVTRGDSDSIACLAGAFAGAVHGMAGWPAGWSDRIEYRDELAAHAAAWDESSST